MDNPRLVGHIVSVQGFRVKVELLPETRSALRATLDGVQAAIAINAYLTFSLGAGETVIGIITDLEARETFDPANGDDLSLELMKPRRIASVQLLGTIEHADDEPSFNPGISVLPTLDTPAEIGSPDILRGLRDSATAQQAGRIHRAGLRLRSKDRLSDRTGPQCCPRLLQ